MAAAGPHLITIYPAYLNSNKTREEGRRISKEKSIEDPNVMEIAEVLKPIGGQIFVEPHKLYPRERNIEDPQFRGRVRVSLETIKQSKDVKDKLELLIFISQEISKLNRKKFQMASVAAPEPIAEPAPKKSGRRNNRKK